MGEIFEPAVADLYDVRRIAAGPTPPDLVVDVGANIGAFSCLAAWLLPAARIVAFEPSEEHAGQLERNVAHNALPNIQLHRKALTSDGREVRFQVNGDGGSSGLFLPGNQEIVMPSVSPEVIDFSSSRNVMFKLDCEGAEGEIVEWICAHRSALPPQVRVACEFHHWCPIPLPEMARRLSEKGFEVSTPVLFDEQYLFAESRSA